jgi:exopolyphosphatase/guanosine-5'-triphosphate,3'-diphosphate pyrophosphatase
VTKRPEIAAAIDIGSNTIKLTVARIEDGSVVPIASRAEVVRLSQGIGSTGRIADDRIEAALAAMGRFVAMARLHGAESVCAVATEAVRIAGNREDFLERARNELGIEVRTIGGEEEARLTANGVLSQVETDGDVMIADIGGGSTELVATSRGQVRKSISLPLGSGVMTDRFVPSDPPLAEELDQVEEQARALAEPFFRGPGPFDRLILVGGAGEYLMALAGAERQVGAGALDHVRSRVEGLTAAELAPLVGAPVARARVLPAGFAIARTVARLARSSTIESVPNGLRIGMLLELAGAPLAGEAVS